MIKSYKVRLKSSKKLDKIFLQFAGCNRLAYNYTLYFNKRYYNLFKKTLNENKFRKHFTKIKKYKKNLWMNNVSNNTFKQGIRDAFRALKSFFNKKTNFPKFKKKNRSKLSFYNDNISSQFKIESGRVYLCKIGWIQLCETNRIPILDYNKDNHYQNIRIVYDGIYWYLTLSIEDNKNYNFKRYDDIYYGVDLGLKIFVTIAKKENNKITFKKYKSNKLIWKKLEKKKKRIQQSLQRKRNNFKKNNKKKKGRCKPITCSKNYLKELKKLNKVTHRMSNIQKEYIRSIVNSMVKSKPKRITIEDLRVKNLLKNHRLAKWISYNQFYEFKKYLIHKCDQYGIDLVIADQYFPSSKMCYYCGYINKDLKLNDRIYICPQCNTIEDRDINAALNLLDYIDIIS